MRTTEELRRAICSAPDPALLGDDAFTPPDSTFYLCNLLEQRGWLVKDAIRACYLERSYGYQLFNGTRAPTRTFLLRLALAVDLGEKETPGGGGGGDPAPAHPVRQTGPLSPQPV